MVLDRYSRSGQDRCDSRRNSIFQSKIYRPRRKEEEFSLPNYLTNYDMIKGESGTRQSIV